MDLATLDRQINPKIQLFCASYDFSIECNNFHCSFLLRKQPLANAEAKYSLGESCKYLNPKCALSRNSLISCI